MIQRAVEDENDDTLRDLRGNDGHRVLEKLYNGLEENLLVIRTSMDGIQISPMLSDLLKKLTDIRNENNGKKNSLPAEIEIPFPVVTNEYTPPTNSFWEVKGTPPDSEENRTHKIFLTKLISCCLATLGCK